MKRLQWGALSCSVVLVVAALLWWRSRDTYLRYTSPPLADGTRYTFLYPSGLHFSERTLRSVSLQDKTRRPGWFEELQEIISHRRRVDSLPNMLNVSIQPLSKTLSPGNRDREEHSGPRWHDIHLADRRHGRLFVLHHWGRMGEEAKFARQTAVVARSFTLLPPGTHASP